MSRRIAILGLDGCMATSLLGTQDLFDVANLIARRISGGGQLFSLRLVSPDGSDFRCSNGIVIPVAGGLDSVLPGDILITPGFMVSRPGELDGAKLRWQPLLPWLHSHGPRLEMLVSNCSGSFLLAEAGLLDGGRATTAWWLHDEMRRRYPKIEVETDDLCVRWGNILTGGATSSFYDTATLLIERYAGKHIARLVAKYMMLDNQRSSQAPYAILSQFDAEDPVVEKAERWIRSNISREFRIEELASAVAVSPRTLIRRFQKALDESPQSFTQKLRIEKSKILLETTQLRFSEIVQRCGYSDESAFRRLFKRYCQLSPREYRQRFNPRREKPALAEG